MKQATNVVLLLFATIALISWQSSSRAQSVARVGVVVSDLTTKQENNRGLPSRGVYVVDVRNDTSAARAGVMAKDVILELDGVPIEGVDDFLCRVARKQPGDAVQFVILRGLAPLTITVSLGTWPKELARLRRLPTGCSVADVRRHLISFPTVGRSSSKVA